MPDMLTASQAAKLVGKSPSTIRRMIKEKKIPSRKSAEGWNMVTKHDLLSAFMTTSSDTQTTAHQQSESLSDRTMHVLEKQLSIANTTIESLTVENRKLLEENFRLIRRLEDRFEAWQAEMKALISDQDKEKGIISRWLRS